MWVYRGKSKSAARQPPGRPHKDGEHIRGRRQGQTHQHRSGKINRKHDWRGIPREHHIVTDTWWNDFVKKKIQTIKLKPLSVVGKTNL